MEVQLRSLTQPVWCGPVAPLFRLAVIGHQKRYTSVMAPWVASNSAESNVEPTSQDWDTASFDCITPACYHSGGYNGVALFNANKQRHWRQGSLLRQYCTVSAWKGRACELLCVWVSSRIVLPPREQIQVIDHLWSWWKKQSITPTPSFPQPRFACGIPGVRERESEREKTGAEGEKKRGEHSVSH